MGRKESDRVMSERLEQRVRDRLDSFYNVVAFVHLDKGKEEDYVFEQNKRKLLDYCKANDVYIYNPFDFLRAISAKMTGTQILELSSRDYMSCIDLGDQPDFGAD